MTCLRIFWSRLNYFKTTTLHKADSNITIRIRFLKYLVNSETMENEANSIESLLTKVTDYGKTSYELVKLKVVDKTADSLSSFIARSIVKVIVGCFLLFLNLGVALWLGELLGKIYFGFFAIALFYFFVAFVLHFFMHKWMKRMFYDYFIRQMLK